jgi:hypothetical protein
MCSRVVGRVAQQTEKKTLCKKLKDFIKEILCKDLCKWGKRNVSCLLWEVFIHKAVHN